MNTIKGLDKFSTGDNPKQNVMYSMQLTRLSVIWYQAQAKDFKSYFIVFYLFIIIWWFDIIPISKWDLFTPLCIGRLTFIFHLRSHISDIQISTWISSKSNIEHFHTKDKQNTFLSYPLHSTLLKQILC